MCSDWQNGDHTAESCGRRRLLLGLKLLDLQSEGVLRSNLDGTFRPGVNTLAQAGDVTLIGEVLDCPGEFQMLANIVTAGQIKGVVARELTLPDVAGSRDRLDVVAIAIFLKWGIQLFTVTLQLCNGIKERFRSTQNSQGGD